MLPPKSPRRNDAKKGVEVVEVAEVPDFIGFPRPPLRHFEHRKWWEEGGETARTRLSFAVRTSLPAAELRPDHGGRPFSTVCHFNRSRPISRLQPETQEQTTDDDISKARRT